MTTTKLRVKDLPIAGRLLVAWITDNIDPSLAHGMAGFLISQAGYLAHRLGLNHDMWMRLCDLAWPERRGGSIVDSMGNPTPHRELNEHDLSERWFE